MVTASSRPHPAEAAAFSRQSPAGELARPDAVVRPREADRAAGTIPEWEELREAASRIKQGTRSPTSETSWEQFESECP